MENKPIFLTTEEAADLLNVHVSTILRWIKTGRLPSSQIGKQYRIPRDAIENRTSKMGSGTRIIAVANQKGGVAKTTTTLNLAAGLGKKGKVELKQLLAAEQVLKRKLNEILDDYDYVLFDCPPSLGMLTLNAFTAARVLLIPMSMEYLALRGLDMLAKMVTKIRSITNPELSYLGILATKYDRRTLNSQEIFEALQQASKNAGIQMFNTYITSSVRFTESPNAKAPLIVSDPDHEGSKAYAQVVEEIIHG